MKHKEMSDTGWAKQFEQTYGENIFILISKSLDSWLQREFVNNDEFKQHLDRYYAENFIHYRPTVTKLNKAIDAFCRHSNILFDKDAVERVNGIPHKGKRFKLIVQTDEVPF